MPESFPPQAKKRAATTEASEAPVPKVGKRAAGKAAAKGRVKQAAQAAEARHAAAEEAPVAETQEEAEAEASSGRFVFSLDGVVKRTDMVSKSACLDKRCDQCDGLTVQQCLEIEYVKKNGSIATYLMADLNYDVKAGRLRVIDGTIPSQKAETADEVQAEAGKKKAAGKAASKRGRPKKQPK